MFLYLHYMSKRAIGIKINSFCWKLMYMFFMKKIVRIDHTFGRKM
jgi:hypothetical protein